MGPLIYITADRILGEIARDATGRGRFAFDTAGDIHLDAETPVRYRLGNRAIFRQADRAIGGCFCQICERMGAASSWRCSVSRSFARPPAATLVKNRPCAKAPARGGGSTGRSTYRGAYALNQLIYEA